MGKTNGQKLQPLGNKSSYWRTRIRIDQLWDRRSKSVNSGGSDRWAWHAMRGTVLVVLFYYYLVILGSSYSLLYLQV